MSIGQSYASEIYAISKKKEAAYGDDITDGTKYLTVLRKNAQFMRPQIQRFRNDRYIGGGLTGRIFSEPLISETTMTISNDATIDETLLSLAYAAGGANNTETDPATDPISGATLSLESGVHAHYISPQDLDAESQLSSCNHVEKVGTFFRRGVGFQVEQFSLASTRFDPVQISANWRGSGWFETEDSTSPDISLSAASLTNFAVKLLRGVDLWVTSGNPSLDLVELFIAHGYNFQHTNQFAVQSGRFHRGVTVGPAGSTAICNSQMLCIDRQNSLVINGRFVSGYDYLDDELTNAEITGFWIQSLGGTIPGKSTRYSVKIFFPLVKIGDVENVDDDGTIGQQITVEPLNNGTDPIWTAEVITDQATIFTA